MGPFDFFHFFEWVDMLGVALVFVQGWVGGYLGNPEREEQRVSDAYKAGYQDGRKQVTDAALDWA